MAPKLSQCNCRVVSICLLTHNMAVFHGVRIDHRSSAFRNKVVELCMETIVKFGTNCKQYTDDEVIEELDTYWRNVSKEYAFQMDRAKRVNKDLASQRDRRGIRIDRVSTKGFWEIIITNRSFPL